MPANAAPDLITAAANVDVTLDTAQKDKLLAYTDLLKRWNQRFNLVSPGSIARLDTVHLLDSLAVAPFVSAVDSRWLDVGSGAGLPGIPLAIALPEQRFTLLDSNSKKTRFIQQAITELALRNVTVEHSRVEALAAPELFDGIICRAYASIAKGLASFGALCKDGGHCVFMKGKDPQEELQEYTQLQGGKKKQGSQENLRELLKVYTVTNNHRLEIPGLDAQRHLVVFQCRDTKNKCYKSKTK